MRFFTLIAVMSLFACNTAGQAAPAAADVCFGPLAAVLAKGGYSGSLDCSALKVDIKIAGTVKVGQKSYDVYDFRYQTMPKAGGVAHGGQRLLIVLDGDTYLGQYDLDTPPFHAVSVKGSSVFIDVPADSGNEIKIGADGPPPSVFLDDDNRDLAK